jgi:hypothetical protein
MDEQYKQRLIQNLPKNITIYGSTDYPNEGIAKIQGVCMKCGWSLEWHYFEDPDYIHIETTCIDQSGHSGNIPIENIKDYLS